MASRREFLQQGLGLTAAGFLSVPLIGCASDSAARKTSAGAAAKPASARVAAPAVITQARPAAGMPSASPRSAPSGLGSGEIEPPPDIFDAQLLDMEFWLKPRTIEVFRPASNERAKLLYWRDGEIIESAYQDLCHLLRDVNGKETARIDPKLFETLWGTQAFVQRYGIDTPLEILSGYRTSASNNKLREAGAVVEADAALAEALDEAAQHFGVQIGDADVGGWIHADTGLKRTWKG